MAAFPDIRPSSIEWWLDSNTLVHQSPLSRSTHTLELPGARWRVSMTFSNLLRPELDALTAFVNGLRGAAGRFTFGPLQQTPIPVVWSPHLIPSLPWFAHFVITEEPGGDHKSVTVPAGATEAVMFFGNRAIGAALFESGYFFSVNGELKQVTETPQQPLGDPPQTLVAFTPPLRASVTGREKVELLDPVSTFRLIDDQQGRAGYHGGGRVGDVTLEIVEAF